jgi:hypothetical protein
LQEFCFHHHCFAPPTLLQISVEPDGPDVWQQAGQRRDARLRVCLAAMSSWHGEWNYPECHLSLNFSSNVPFQFEISPQARSCSNMYYALVAVKFAQFFLVQGNVDNSS